MKPLRLEDLAYAGFIVKPWGFQGHLIVGCEALDEDDFPNSGFLFLKVDGLPVPFRIEECARKGGHLTVKLEDLSTEQDAKALAGLEVYLPLLEADETTADPSWDELVGYEVTDEIAGAIGRIEEVEEFPMQFIATVNYSGREVLFPLNESLVISIDVNQRRITVRLPDGLLDIYS